MGTNLKTIVPAINGRRINMDLLCGQVFLSVTFQHVPANQRVRPELSSSLRATCQVCSTQAEMCLNLTAADEYPHSTCQLLYLCRIITPCAFPLGYNSIILKRQGLFT